MLPLIGMAAGLIPAVSGLITAGKQKRMAKGAARDADRLNQQTLSFANQQLGTAQGLNAQAQNNYNARMAGAAGAEQNIFRNQANQMAQASRGATNSADLLAVGGMAQGASNDAFANLAMAEAQDKQRRFGDVQQTTGTLMGAQNNLQGYYGQQSAQAQQSANQLMNASMQNKQNAFNQIGQVGMMAGMGGFGKLTGMFAKGGGAAGMAGGGTLDAIRGGGGSPLLSAAAQSGFLGGLHGSPMQAYSALPGAANPISSGLYTPKINFGLKLGQ